MGNGDDVGVTDGVGSGGEIEGVIVGVTDGVGVLLDVKLTVGVCVGVTL